ncbi:MAG: CpsD/CapB family tyrosine-protein kinase [Chloracidobacterium sp.]|nr:CpsD/CapB family tyrosine-protein kinase [Chloracidobacterium sp.]
MKFLKTIQKHESEKPSAIEAESPVPGDSVQGGEDRNQPPGLLAMREFRIGVPQNAEAPTKPANGNGTLNPVRGEAVRVTDPFAQPGMPKCREIVVNPALVNPRVVSITHPRSAYCEEYRNLRTQVLHKSKKRKLQAIVVASVGPSEGKSVTALNLSWLFAQTDGVRALIIDSDLRRPSLASYLGIESAVGLSEVLTGGSSLMGSIVRLQPSGLYLLPGGSARSDVAELISGPRFAEILKEARAYFDFIIIDAPPLGIFTDASLLINLADGAMLVIRANHTKYKDVDRILDTLPRERMLGTILNQSEVPLMDESYYKYGFYDRDVTVKA